MEYTDQECKEIAGTIFQQLGGGRFAMMVGVKDLGFIRTDEGVALVFKFMRNKSGMNYLRVVYDCGKDLYNMIFYKTIFSKKDLEVKFTEKKFDSIFCDQLTEIFENYTGLYTRLY